MKLTQKVLYLITLPIFVIINMEKIIEPFWNFNQNKITLAREMRFALWRCVLMKNSCYDNLGFGFKEKITQKMHDLIVIQLECCYPNNTFPLIFVHYLLIFSDSMWALCFHHNHTEGSDSETRPHPNKEDKSIIKHLHSPHHSHNSPLRQVCYQSKTCLTDSFTNQNRYQKWKQTHFA